MVDNGKTCIISLHFKRICPKLCSRFTDIEKFNGVLEEKDRYSLLLFRYSPEGNIFVVRETKIFSLRIFGEYELAI